MRASNSDGNSTAVYLMRVVATKSMMRRSPTTTSCTRAPITLSAPIAANIMDGHDFDYFAITAGEAEATLIASLKNRSTTLQPELALYDGSKRQLGTRSQHHPRR